MLRLFGPDCPPAPFEASASTAIPKGAVWLDLYEPSAEEETAAEQAIGVNLPTPEELAEIEPSSRMYERKGALYLTLSVLHGLDDGDPDVDPVGFVLTDKMLATIRHTDPLPFVSYAEELYADPDDARDAHRLFVGLLDAIVDRLADDFEDTGREIEAITDRIFDKRVRQRGRAPGMRLEALLIRVGRAQRTVGKLREASMSATRLLTFLGNCDSFEGDAAGLRQIESMKADVRALNELAAFYGDNLVFLLDATLGLVSLEQNQVMKIFSVVAVVLMPPTLVAGIYGMNFDHMPELRWLLGYPLALALMLASAVLPYWFARRRGWL